MSVPGIKAVFARPSLWSAFTTLAFEPAPDVLGQEVPPKPNRQRLVVQRHTPVAFPTECAEGERPMLGLETVRAAGRYSRFATENSW